MHIHTSSRHVFWTPPSLEEAEPKPTFEIKPATPLDADTLGYELYRRGLSPVDQPQLRATMIDELFNIYGDEKGEEHANDFEAVWQAEEAYEAEVALWMEQEAQRLADIGAGAPERPKAEFPKRQTSIRLRSRVQLLGNEVSQKSQRIRDLTVEMNSYGRRQAAMVLRLQVKGWTGVSAPYEIVDGILSEASLEALFMEIGHVAYRELERHISQMYELSEEEEKNSDSLLENEPGVSGSPAPSDGSASSDGQWTGSNTTQTPAEGSAATTEPS